MHHFVYYTLYPFKNNYCRNYNSNINFFSRDIDEIVLAYVVGILQDLTSTNSAWDEESFDVDAFCEMLTAYIPQTSGVLQTEISDWMFGLVQAQREADDHYNSTKFSNLDITSMIEQTIRGPKERTNSTGSSGSSRLSKTNSDCSESAFDKKRIARFSENSDGGDAFDVSYLK